MYVNDLIYDWNTHQQRISKPKHTLHFLDETIRDGLQSPYLKMPSVSERIEILKCSQNVGIDSANIGMPAAGMVQKQEVLKLAQQIKMEKIKLQLNCVARTVINDVIPIIEIVEKTAMPLAAYIFLGASPIRQYAEHWNMKTLCELTQKSISFGVEHGLDVAFVTEDTTRSNPQDIERLYLTAIEAGAETICVADTVGHATPEGVFNLVSFIKEMLDKRSLAHIKIDFHGHMDRQLGVWNSVCAFAAGAFRVHGCALGIGERCGNTPLDVLILNLHLMGWTHKNLKALPAYVHTVANILHTEIPKNYPGLGEAAFTTATGVHASTICKALEQGDRDVADSVYSGVPASDLGLSQIIQIGPLSGHSNVELWLKRHKLEPSKELVVKILDQAKHTDRVLLDHEIYAIINKTDQSLRPANEKIETSIFDSNKKLC